MPTTPKVEEEDPYAALPEAKDPYADMAPANIPSSVPNTPETGVGRFLSGVMAHAPAIAATVGGVAGTPLGGPAGSIAGATIGGMLGKSLQQGGNPNAPKPGTFNAPVVKEGAIQGALQGVGEGAGVALKAAAPAASRAADSIMANILGVGKAQTGKVGDLVSRAKDIGNAVNNLPSVGLTLDGIGSRISAGKDALLGRTDQIIQNAKATGKIDLHSLISNLGEDGIDKANTDIGKQNTYKVFSTLVKKYGDATGNINPQEALELRRTLLNSKLWPAQTGTFRTNLYHELNRSIQAVLPPEEAERFAMNNLHVTRLIKAENALQSTRLKSFASKAAVPGAGAGVGAAIGYEKGHNLESAAKGAVVGAAAGSTPSRAGVAMALRGLPTVAKVAPNVIAGGARSIGDLLHSASRDIDPNAP